MVVRRSARTVLELSVFETRVSIRGLTFARTSHAEKTIQRYEREDEWRTIAFRNTIKFDGTRAW